MQNEQKCEKLSPLMMMPPPTAQSTYGQPPPFNPPLTRPLSISPQPPTSSYPKKKPTAIIQFNIHCHLLPLFFCFSSLHFSSSLVLFFFFFCVLSAQFSDIFQTRKDSETNGRRAERGVGVGKK